MTALQELHDLQINSGGVPVDPSPQQPSTYRFCRPAMLHFGDAGAEYVTAKNHAAIFDVSDRTRIELRGPDAKIVFAGFLHERHSQTQLGRRLRSVYHECQRAGPRACFRVC